MVLVNDISEMAVRNDLGFTSAGKRSMLASQEQWVRHWCRRRVERFLRVVVVVVVVVLLLLLAMVPTAYRITVVSQAIRNVTSTMVCVNRCWVFVAGGSVLFSLIVVVSCGAAV